eukprot:2347427-Rhodomonas_salina.5
MPAVWFKTRPSLPPLYSTTYLPSGIRAREGEQDPSASSPGRRFLRREEKSQTVRRITLCCTQTLPCSHTALSPISLPFIHPKSTQPDNALHPRRSQSRSSTLDNLRFAARACPIHLSTLLALRVQILRGAEPRLDALVGVEQVASLHLTHSVHDVASPQHHAELVQAAHERANRPRDLGDAEDESGERQHHVVRRHLARAPCFPHDFCAQLRVAPLESHTRDTQLSTHLIRRRCTQHEVRGKLEEDRTEKAVAAAALRSAWCVEVLSGSSSLARHSRRSDSLLWTALRLGASGTSTFAAGPHSPIINLNPGPSPAAWA